MTFSGRDYAVGLLLAESERDRQVKIGASNMSNTCARCLARDLAGDREGSNTRAFLGGRLGTGTHLLMEWLQEELVQQGKVVLEEKIHLGHLEGYGDVNSKPDCVHLEEHVLIDWKTSQRQKAKAMQQFLNYPVASPLSDKEKLAAGASKVKSYIAQTQLYADALIKLGTRIDDISLVFINRDGTGWFDHPDFEDYYNPNKQRDVWEIQVKPDAAYAASLWTRTQTIYDGLQGGATPNDFAREEYCHRCSFVEEMALDRQLEKA